MTAPNANPDDLASAEAGYDAAVRRDLPRNYAAHLVHGLLGQTGFRLVQAPTFVPAYIFLLSGSELAVGAALAAQYLGMAASSLLGATLIEHRRRVLPVGFVTGGLMRIQVLGLALSGFFLTGPHALVAAVVFLGLFGFFNGIQAVIFNVLMAKVIPISYRGRLTGLRNFLAGLTASGVAYLGGKYFIETQALGNGYATTFLTAFCLTSLGLVILLFVREPEPPVVRAQSGLLKRLRDVPAIFRHDPAFAKFFYARALASLGTAAIPFYILFAGERIGLSGATIGYLSIAFLLSQTATNLLWGPLADRAGNRFVFLASVGLWTAATLALMMAHGLLPTIIVFCGLGSGFGGFQIATQNLVLEFGDRQDIPMRIALSNVGGALAMAIGPLIGGWLADTISFESVFWTAATLKLASIILVIFFVDEPRKRRMQIT